MIYHSKVKEAVKQIAFWYDLDLNEFEKNRLSNLLGQLREVKEVIKIVHKPIQVESIEKPPIDWENELKEACRIYGCDYERIKGRSRNSKYVSARTHFVRRLKIYDPSITIVSMADYLKRDHTSILAMLYKSKAYCLIQPLERPKVKYAA